MNSQPIIIIGGGVAGLSTAWHLLLAGQKVLVLEKETLGCGASDKAAGMVTPSAEVLFGEQKLLHLFVESLAIYPEFIRKLEQASRMPTDFQTGSFILAVDNDDEGELMRLFEFQRELGFDVNLRTPEEVLKKEPLVSSQFVSAIEAPHEAFLDNMALIKAFRLAILSLGGGVLENSPVEAIDIHQGKVRAVYSKQQKIETSTVVVASGIDLDFKGVPPDIFPSLRPIKGQAFELRQKGPFFLKKVIRTIHRFPVYCVPRSDGRLTIGATCEEMGHDRRITAGALLDLMTGAWRVLPQLDDMEFIGPWVGFRPATRDHAPVIGPTSVEGLILALGFYRHGILLTPIIGKLLTDWIIHQKHSDYFETFKAGRFAAK